MALVVAVGGSGRHAVLVAIGNALGLVVVGDILDEGDAADDTHHLLTAAGSQGRDVVIDAVGHVGIVGDIAGGVDALALVVNGNRGLEQRGADVLAADEEDAVHVLHRLSDVGIAVLSGLDLVGISLLELAGGVDVLGEDVVLSVITDSVAHDLVQLNGDTAGFLDNGLVVGILLVLAVIGPGQADDGLGAHGGGSSQHGFSLGLGGGGGGAVSKAVGQAGPSGGLVNILGPHGQVGVGNFGKAQDDGCGLALGDLGVGIELTAANAVDQALLSGQVDGTLIGAALGNIGKDAGLGSSRGLLGGKACVVHHHIHQLCTGQAVRGGQSRCRHAEHHCSRNEQGQELSCGAFSHSVSPFMLELLEMNIRDV